jgi:hypothetical protein
MLKLIFKINFVKNALPAALQGNVKMTKTLQGRICYRNSQGSLTRH